MKKIFAFLFIAAALASGFAAKVKLKDQITETKIGSYDEFEVGSGNLKIKKLTGNQLESRDFTVNFNPRKNTCGLEYKRLAMKERLIFDMDARKAFIDSYNSYIEDYNAKKLDRKQKKISNPYGQARMRIDWGAFTYNIHAHPKAEFGYVFVGKSPYMAIRIESKKADATKDGITPEYSGTVLYFTRAQVADLVEALSEETISNGMKSLLSEDTSDDYAEDDEKEKSVDQADYEEE